METYRTPVVNLLVGFGIPWVIAAHYNQYYYGWKPDQFIGYFVPSEALGFNLLLLIGCIIITLIFFGARRAINGGIMMGKSECGGIMSLLFLILIWIIYVSLSGAWATDYISSNSFSAGIDLTKTNIIRGCTHQNSNSLSPRI